mgnify:FL=1|tara:strand:- start:1103 stop:3859 length:2757 start_codon:yes stop_codon:yes gene_type:complete
MTEKHIVITNARVNNLKNIDIKIPRNKLVVITGISGSGKTSLAFDTIFAEGQRRYVESLSSYARQFLNRVDKPNVDSISGISPSIAVDQKRNTRNPRSSVGSVTELYDYLKLLFSRIGETISPKSGEVVKRESEKDVISFLLKQKHNSKYIIYFNQEIKTTLYKRQLDVLLQKGFTRIFEDSKIKYIEDLIKSPPKKTVAVLLDRGKTNPLDESTQFKIRDVVKKGFFEGKGKIIVKIEDGKEKTFSNLFEKDGFKFHEPSLNFFNSNSPFGACKNCSGFGNTLGIDKRLIIPNENISVYGGAVAPWRTKKMSRWLNPLILNNNIFNFSIHKPYNKLSEKEIDILWNGKGVFKGINKFFDYLSSKKHKIQYRVMASRYKGKTTCNECLGTGIRKEASYVKINNKSIQELLTSPIEDLLFFFKKIKLNQTKKKVSSRIISELTLRLELVNQVGLGYLTLNRRSNTLSGGEFQRIKLTTALGSPLVGSLYVLDEPTIGLHPDDTFKLIRILKYLRDIGNSVLVVEHDADMIKSSDYLIDIGPKAGINGGKIMFQGNPKALKAESCLTGRFIKKTDIQLNKNYKKTTKKIIIKNARENNLRNLNITIPLGVFVVVTGVSGSGKSTLVNNVLYSTLAKRFGRKPDRIGKCDSIEGDLNYISNIEIVTQNSLGISSRSNPVTYTKTYDIIRKLFSDQKKAKRLNLKPAHFSFNVEGGRCSECLGEGVKKIEMQFMADIILECEECKGKRFNKSILSIKYNNKNIFEVLDLTIDEAFLFFEENNQIIKKLKSLKEVGLGYLKLGQQTSTLSGGEAQRLKLASFLDLSKSKKETNSLFILDEPTTGLHYYDIEKLLISINKLVDSGNSIICIEHNLEVIRNSDWIIDLGPSGGKNGGNICFQGTPKDLIKKKKNLTAMYLANKVI